MFSVKHNECVGFESKWKVKKVYSNTTTQTTQFSVSEKGCVTTEQKSQGAQTNEENPEPKEVDMDRLAEWLKKIYPKVKKQIDDANNSRAFRNYRLLDDPIDSTCKLVQSLKVASIGETITKAKPIVACLDWNHSGKSLAVSQNFKHKTWCHHMGQILIYTLNRDEKLDENRKKVLTTDSCVTAIKYHPLNSAILAAGTFGGQIFIWNTENDIDPILCNIVAHDEYVTHISWVNDIDSSKSVLLASSSTDGLLKMFNFSVSEGDLKIKTIYKIKTPILRRMGDTLEDSRKQIDTGDLGIVCFDFSKFIPDMFVVALDSGIVARCSLLGTTKLSETVAGIHLHDPVYKYYEPHVGEIITLQFSPNHKDMFLTYATDGEIRIYLIDQDDPAQVICIDTILNDVMFILHEEKLVAACGINGKLEVFHILKRKPIELNFDTKVTKRRLTSLAINDSKTNYVAVGNDIGELQLWNIPWPNIELQNRR